MKKIFSLILTIQMIFALIIIPKVNAAETEAVPGSNAAEATEVFLDIEYFMSFDEDFKEAYFSFNTEEEGFYEVIAVSNTGGFDARFLSANEKELGSTYFNSTQEKVLSKRLDGGEKYLIEFNCSSYGKPSPGKIFFRINYKKDEVSDNINNAKSLSLDEKFYTQIEGADDVDGYSYTNNNGEKQIVTMILANTTGGSKWAGIFNETEEQIGSFYYNDFAIPKGSTAQEDFEIEAGEQVFVKVKLNSVNSYEIGDNSYYILIQEKQCEHKSVSKNNYVTEYEEIVGDENNHYVIKYYDKICDSCGEITEKKIQDSKYKESHNFDGNYCENCYFEKESVPVENTPEYIDSDYDEPIIDGKTSFGSNVSEWAEKEMEEAYDNELIPEILVGEDLRKRVTRAEFAAIAVQLYEELTGTYASAVGYCPFEDISDNVSYDSIKKAYLLDITMGTEYNIFEPYTLITREQLATMLCRAIKKYSDKNWTLANDEEFYLDISGVPKFADDADISDYAKPSVYYMAKMGIIAGVDSTHFAPKNTTTYQEAVGYAMATREQAIAISLRIFNSADML